MDRAAENATTNIQKTYLIRNLQKIEDVDGYFYRTHQTGSVVSYTEKGLVIDNQIALAPEAYNQMGKEQLRQKLDDITNCPTRQEREKYTERLLRNYDSDDFRNVATNYVERTMTPDQHDEFDRKINEMAVRRKDQFFWDTAPFQTTPQYRENIVAAEKGIASGNNIEILIQEQKMLDAAKDAGTISQQEYNQRVQEINGNLEEAKHARQIRKYDDKYVQISTTERNSIVDDYVKQRASGRTEKQWEQMRENLERQYKNIPEESRQQPNIRERFEVSEIKY